MIEWSTMDALRMAYQFEKENFDEYTRGAAETKDPGVKSMFEFLAGEERKHMNLIREMMRRHDVKP